MKLLPFNESYRTALVEFLITRESSSVPVFLPSDPRGLTLLAKEGEKLLGLASIAKNKFHPRFERFYCEVDPYEAGLKQVLFDKICSWRGDDSLRLQFMLAEAEIAAESKFLDSNGFAFTLRCECPEIDVENSIFALPQSEISPPFSLCNYLQMSSSQKSALFEFRIAGYIKAHSWSPPISVNSPLWYETELNPDDQSVSWAIFKGHKPVLCSDAHIDASSLWLGWGWHCDDSLCTSEIDQLWLSVLRLQLNHCRQHNLRLFGEFDSTDACAQIKHRWLIDLNEDSQLIYQQVDKLQSEVKSNN